MCNSSKCPGLDYCSLLWKTTIKWILNAFKLATTEHILYPCSITTSPAGWLSLAYPKASDTHDLITAVVPQNLPESSVCRHTPYHLFHTCAHKLGCYHGDIATKKTANKNTSRGLLCRDSYRLDFVWTGSSLPLNICSSTWNTCNKDTIGFLNFICRED